MNTTRMAAALSFLLVFVCCSSRQSRPEEESPSFLHADGTKIVDGRGEEVVLRGMGLGGWMLQEGYMMHTGGPQYRIEAKIEELVGPERATQFYDAWLANHTREDDVAALASWGFNSIRLPMHFQLFTPPVEEEPVPGEITWRDTGFEKVDELLGWAAGHEVYLILDMHAAPGGQGKNADINDYDPTKPSLWESDANQDKLVALWRKLAERYAEEPWIGGYDMINEPNWGFGDVEGDPNGCDETGNAPLWDLQQRITAAIREVDTNHLLFVEGNCWGNNYKSLPQLWDDNLAISFHKYWNYNDQDAIQWVLDLREERGVPVWLGESGENSNTWFTDAIALVESHGIGWAWWPLKKQGFNNPLEIVTNPGYQRLIDYWRAVENDEADGAVEPTATRPTADEAFAALMRLTEDLKFENNLFHRDVVDAMIRQPNTDDVVAFRERTIRATGETEILAVEYDLGKSDHAYRDTVVANYRVSTGGPWVAWNEGRTFRNDGVDIRTAPDGSFYVGWTEPGEWLQYTLAVADAGSYTVGLVTSGAGTEPGVVSILVDDEPVATGLELPKTEDRRTTRVSEVHLTQGTVRLRVLVERGGFDLSAITISP